MHDLSDRDGPQTPCRITNIPLPNFIDHDHPPIKKPPFSTIHTHPSTHTLTLLLPASRAPAFPSTSPPPAPLHYARLHLKLLDIITGPFFTTYIKSPGARHQLLMRSSGRAGIDPTFTLVDGVLRLEVDRPTFERMGLDGTAVPSAAGRKHVPARYAVVLDLRRPEMVRGRSGFERVVWAFRHAEGVAAAVAWVVVDVKDLAGGWLAEGPVRDFAPIVVRVDGEVEGLGVVARPAWPRDVREDEGAEVAELGEWLGLAMMGSPRVRVGDGLDPYLCRYQVPDHFGEVAEEGVVRIQWRGLLCSGFVQKIFLGALKAAGDEWFAVKTYAFDGEAYVALVHQGHALTFEFKD